MIPKTDVSWKVICSPNSNSFPLIGIYSILLESNTSANTARHPELDPKISSPSNASSALPLKLSTLDKFNCGILANPFVEDS